MIRKKTFWLVVIILTIWNIVLTYMFYDKSKTIQEGTENITVIENEVNGFSTDLTHLYDDVISSIVTVRSDTANGTGVIIRQVDNTVYVATSYHIIEGAETVDIAIDNYQEIEATIVGFDAIRDVAILSFESVFRVDPIDFGASALLESGEFVVAIGSPLSVDYRGSLSFGLVSSARRTLELTVSDQDYFITMIQTDVTLNSGNSGGPLINMAGELVGLNTLSMTVDDASGLSFALSSAELRHIADEIIETGEVTKCDLGIRTVELSSMTNYQKAALNIDLDVVSGLLVRDVKADFLANSIGLRTGDIILEINDETIDDIYDLIDAEYTIEDHVDIEILRGSEAMTLSLEIGS